MELRSIKSGVTEILTDQTGVSIHDQTPQPKRAFRLPLGRALGAGALSLAVLTGAASTLQIHENNDPSVPNRVTDGCEANGFTADEVVPIGPNQQHAISASRLGGTICQLTNGDFAKVR